MLNLQEWTVPGGSWNYVTSNELLWFSWDKHSMRRWAKNETRWDRHRRGAGRGRGGAGRGAGGGVGVALHIRRNQNPATSDKFPALHVTAGSLFQMSLKRDSLLVTTMANSVTISIDFLLKRVTGWFYIVLCDVLVRISRASSSVFWTYIRVYIFSNIR